MVRSFRSSSRRNSRSSEPTMGSAMIEVRMGKVITLLPQVVSEHHHDAQEQRGGIRADRAGLQPPEYRAERADRLGHAVDHGVDAPHVHALPEAAFRQNA